VTALALAYVAGLLTTLNPCVLPMLPLVLAGTASGGRLGPVAFAAGMVAAFTAVGLFVATVGIGLGVTSEVLRQAAAAMFVLFGLVLLAKPLQERFALATAGLATGANALAGRVTVGGLGGPFLVGSLAGALWSPCSGPSLGAAVVLATEAGGLGPAATRMFAFGLGAASILMLLAYGSRAAILGRRDALLAASRWLKPAAGALFVGLGALVLTGLDKAIEAALVAAMPDWLVAFTTRF
jgi:cytochrome c biogenesis protein CcdA